VNTELKLLKLFAIDNIKMCTKLRNIKMNISSTGHVKNYCVIFFFFWPRIMRAQNMWIKNTKKKGKIPHIHIWKLLLLIRKIRRRHGLFHFLSRISIFLWHFLLKTNLQVLFHFDSRSRISRSSWIPQRRPLAQSVEHEMCESIRRPLARKTY